MRRLLLHALLLSLPALTLTAGGAAARSGPCLVDGSGPVCELWLGKVESVADGDTLDVDIRGDGTRTPRRIRVTGIQAMELSRYSRYAARRRGECHATAATSRLDRLVRRARGRVRLAARDPRSRSGTRIRRSVAVRIGRRWRDVGRVMVAEGHALWLPNSVEWAPNQAYSRLAERAAARRLRLWDPSSCRPGPHADVGFSINWDADGYDSDNVNGEWFEITNRGGAHLPLGGWWVRDSHLRRFVFPAGAGVAPGDTVRVRVGAGRHTPWTFHWGQPEPVFENASRDARGMGDGGYLFDPDGDLRAFEMYR